MATYDNQKLVSMVAEADLSTHVFKFVKHGANAEGMLLADGTGSVIGVLQNKPPQGQPGAVAIGGKVRVRAGGTIAVGATVTTSNAGLAVAGSTGILGTAATAGVNGQLMEVFFSKTGA